jgi:uncharacterized small protein (DUF1192 family)
MEHLKSINQLKKENERAQGKIKLLLKSCKQLEEEKKMLQKELSQLEATQKQKTGGRLPGHTSCSRLSWECTIGTLFGTGPLSAAL